MSSASSPPTSSPDIQSDRAASRRDAPPPGIRPATGLVFGVVGARKDDKEEEEEAEGEAEMDGDESTPPLLLATLGPRAPAPRDCYCCKSWTKADFDSTVGIHPTSAEELVTMRSPTRKIRKDPSPAMEKNVDEVRPDRNK